MKNHQMAKEWLKASNYDLEVVKEILDNENHQIACDFFDEVNRILVNEIL